MKKILLLIFFLAFVIRLIALNQSLWLDEATTAKVVKEYGFWQIVSQFSPNDFHPPLYYLFMKIWTNMFGYSEIALRFPSVIFSLLTGWVVYLIGGIWAAAFFLFNPLIIYYSQEARMYMQTTFLLTGSLYFLIKMLQVKSEKLKVKSYNSKLKIYLILFNIFCILSFYTFYGSVFLIMPMLFYLFYKKQYRHFYVACFMLSVTLILLSPLLWQQFRHSRESLTLVVNWRPVLGTASIKNLLLIPLKFSFGRISFYPKILYYLLTGLWTAFVWFFVIRGGFKNRAIMTMMIITVILGLIFSFYSPLLQYFRFLYLLPLVSLLLAQVDERLLYDRAKVVIIGGFLILSLIYLFNPAFHREDWRSLAKSLPKDQPVYMIASSSDALRYYRPDVKVINLKLISDRTENYNQLTVIPYTSDIYRINYRHFLLKNKFYLDKTIYFRGLIVEFWREKLKV